MAFHNIRFPVDISLNSTGGPVRRTDIIQLTSGHEERNSPWAYSRRKYNAGYGVKSIDQLEEIIAFFEARHGRLHSFRWRDPFDYKSCLISNNHRDTDQFISYGVDKFSDIQLIKNYVSGEQIYKRPIKKPIEGTVSLSVNGSSFPTSDFSIDYATGRVMMLKSLSPSDEVRAGYLYDVAVRFDTDSLDISLSAIKAGDIPNISIIEVLET